MDATEVKTVDDVKRLFEDTIFWNWVTPIDEGLADPCHEEVEYPLTVIPLPPAYVVGEDFAGKDVLLRFEHGELTMDLARVFVSCDGEQHANPEDVDYIAALPVTQPMLFREIAKHATAARIAIEVNEQLQRRIGDLEAALKSWVDFMERLDRDLEPTDPIRVERLRYHAKRLAQSRAALAPTSDVGTVTT